VASVFRLRTRTARPRHADDQCEEGEAFRLRVSGEECGTARRDDYAPPTPRRQAFGGLLFD
jgi:hypothetical protein